MLFRNQFRADTPVAMGTNIDQSSESARERYEDLRKTNKALVPLLLVALIATFWLGFIKSAIAAVLLWALACLLVGATVGFLFGIPRSATTTADPTAKVDQTPTDKDAAASRESRGGGRPNTNLEEVSDWLTKIIVGLGLVHLKDISTRIHTISQTAAAALSPTPTAADNSAALALVVGFVVLGFLFGYLYTRLFLQGAFQRSNQDLISDYRRTTEQVLSSTPPANIPDVGKPSLPTAQDHQAAERVLQVAPADRPEEALAPIRALALEYEHTRRDMEFGEPRTRKMADIAKKMKSFGLVAIKFLPQLTQSTSPGERLAAIMALQMQFDPQYIDWLAERLVLEPAFPGYHAASAFLARLPTVGQLEREKIKAAVSLAMKTRQDQGLESESRRDELCKNIIEFKK